MRDRSGHLTHRGCATALIVQYQRWLNFIRRSRAERPQELEQLHLHLTEYQLKCVNALRQGLTLRVAEEDDSQVSQRCFVKLSFELYALAWAGQPPGLVGLDQICDLGVMAANGEYRSWRDVPPHAPADGLAALRRLVESRSPTELQPAQARGNVVRPLVSRVSKAFGLQGTASSSGGGGGGGGGSFSRGSNGSFSRGHRGSTEPAGRKRAMSISHTAMLGSLAERRSSADEANQRWAAMSEGVDGAPPSESSSPAGPRRFMLQRQFTSAAFFGEASVNRGSVETATEAPKSSSSAASVAAAPTAAAAAEGGAAADAHAGAVQSMTPPPAPASCSEGPCGPREREGSSGAFRRMLGGWPNEPTALMSPTPRKASRSLDPMPRRASDTGSSSGSLLGGRRRRLSLTEMSSTPTHMWGAFAASEVFHGSGLSEASRVKRRGAIDERKFVHRRLYVCFTTPAQPVPHRLLFDLPDFSMLHSWLT